MNVRDLNRNQLDQLKWDYFYQLENTNNDILEDIVLYTEIPDEVIFEHYDGINFVQDDFINE